jgi:hypothetical protein
MVRSSDKDCVLSQIPTGRNNALVAESDVKAAVQAIHETFRRHEQRWETQAVATAAAAPAEHENLNPGEEALTGKDSSQRGAEKQSQPAGGAPGQASTSTNLSADFRALHKAVLQDREKRLVESVYRLSQVIPDDLYNNFVKEYCSEYELSDTDESDDADEDDEDDEDEFSPHELVDHLAQQKVDDLRRQVLARARQVQRKRAAVIQRATGIAREATMRSVDPTPKGKPPPSAQLAATDPEKVKRQVASMRESMKELQERLLASERKLERQLDQLKSTVAVIERHQIQGGRNPTQKVDELMRTSFSAAPALQDGNTPVLDPTERLEEFLLG